MLVRERMLQVSSVSVRLSRPQMRGGGVRSIPVFRVLYGWVRQYTYRMLVPHTDGSGADGH